MSEENIGQFTVDDIAYISRILEERHVKKICPMCGNDNLTMMENFGFCEQFQRKDNSFNPIHLGIPTIIIGCNNCGFLMEHALYPLGLTDLKIKESDTKSEVKK